MTHKTVHSNCSVAKGSVAKGSDKTNSDLCCNHFDFGCNNQLRQVDKSFDHEFFHRTVIDDRYFHCSGTLVRQSNFDSCHLYRQCHNFD